jgi:Arc/MetJ-type ribon-helix-helix transcriptional regulator
MEAHEAACDLTRYPDPVQSPRYDSGMTKKIAVSLPDDLVSAARRAVDEGRAASVSAYVAMALARQVREDEVTALLADMRAEHGTPSADDYAWADQVLGLA